MMPPVSRLRSSLLTTVLVALLAVAAHVDAELDAPGSGAVLVAAGVVLVQALIAGAPSLADARGRSVPTPRLVPTLTGGLVATALALFPDAVPGADGTREVSGAADTGTLAGIMPAIAIAVLVSAITQMLRRDGRRELTSALAYAISLATAAALATGWIGTAQSFAGSAAVVVGAAGVAAGVLVWAVPGDRYLLGSCAVVAGALGGISATVVQDSIVTAWFGIAVGSGAGLFAVLGQVLGRALISGRRHASIGWGFPAAMSVALAAPVVYVGGQLVASSPF